MNFRQAIVEVEVEAKRVAAQLRDYEFAESANVLEAVDIAEANPNSAKIVALIGEARIRLVEAEKALGAFAMGLQFGMLIAAELARLRLENVVTHEAS